MSEAIQPRPGARPGAEELGAQSPPRPEDLPLRRRAMPCPHCDAEIPAILSARTEPHCPACDLPLRPVAIAGFWRRLGAGLIDFGILALSAGPIAWGLHRLVDPVPLAPGARGLDLALTVFATDFDTLLLRLGPFLVLVASYFSITVSVAGRTLGQRLLAMQIVDRRGAPPNILVATLRAIAQVAGLCAAALGPLWIAFDSERRALHDLAAGTYVVRSA